MNVATIDSAMLIKYAPENAVLAAQHIIAIQKEMDVLTELHVIRALSRPAIPVVMVAELH